MKISLEDKEQTSELIKTVILIPMERNMTGSITLHFLNGDVKGCEINQMSREIDEIKKMFGG